MTVDRSYLDARDGLFKQIYPDMDIVGWYTTGGPITQENKLFHYQVGYSFNQ